MDSSQKYKYLACLVVGSLLMADTDFLSFVDYLIHHFKYLISVLTYPIIIALVVSEPHLLFCCFVVWLMLVLCFFYRQAYACLNNEASIRIGRETESGIVLNFWMYGMQKNNCPLMLPNGIWKKYLSIGWCAYVQCMFLEG